MCFLQIIFMDLCRINFFGNLCYVLLPPVLFRFFKIFSKFTFKTQRGRRFTRGMSLESSHASYGCGVWGEVQTVQTDAGSEVRGEGATQAGGQ